MPYADHVTIGSAATFIATSAIGISISWPSPVALAVRERREHRERAVDPRDRVDGAAHERLDRPASPVIHAMPDTCSVVCANPRRSRHGPSSPERGHAQQDDVAAARDEVVVLEPDVAGITRGVKFSTTTSACSTSRSTSSRPSGFEKSMVTDRLAGLVPWNVGPYSIQSGSVGGRTVAKRMPSGRVGDSTLITSAPSVARWCVHAGPAQNAVRSSTVTP